MYSLSPMINYYCKGGGGSFVLLIRSIHNCAFCKQHNIINIMMDKKEILWYFGYHIVIQATGSQHKRERERERLAGGALVIHSHAQSSALA